MLCHNGNVADGEDNIADGNINVAVTVVQHMCCTSACPVVSSCCALYHWSYAGSVPTNAAPLYAKEDILIGPGPKGGGGGGGLSAKSKNNFKSCAYRHKAEILLLHMRKPP